ncbi:proline iminopeptidase [Dietzia kunjamensis subsp. schimae]|uniref:Proline iminopeptidase n=1 Tax=Dietzia kunjamensis subsp. schimae TaxID=498198 RepID=A0ABY1N738_9ACTN|nr:prolyl aminopeptidase [Dietzia kunjamensis]MBB1014030.1 prolyl aminopeptidase [Dietzia kunjamensis subsp. schimae]SMO89715.1 proline iminopeptidase [Dietzia kunjamensis subsp. schimae]
MAPTTDPGRGAARRAPYPAIEPHDSGILDVGDGQHVYWECSGNPDGAPVLFVHGGPGGGTTPEHRRMFDPAAYRIILLDQRGCGRSTPHVADGADLTVNTTWHLVDDLERLREHLGVEEWLVFGGSWGSTLALAYAQEHPSRVRGLILRGVFLCRPSEIDWFYRGGAAHLFPDVWEGYLAPLLAADGPDAVHQPAYDHVAAYHRLLHCGDPQVELEAARAWTRWETSTSTLLPRPAGAGGDPDRFALAFARIENHYFVHDAFLGGRAILDRMDRIAHLPAVIVHGRYDVVCPVASAWELHAAWPGSELHIVSDAGHAMAEPGTTHHLLEATDRFRP